MQADNLVYKGVKYTLGGGGGISVGYILKNGSKQISANAYEEVSLSVTLPDGAIPISIVPGQSGTYAEVWNRGQYTVENNILTQKLYVHNRSTGSSANCSYNIQVWFVLGAEQYDGGALTSEEEEL